MRLETIEFDVLSKERGIDIISLVREYTQIEILKKISQSKLKKTLLFKGGTALHLIYNMSRYSEDLDFSVSTKENGEVILSGLKVLITEGEITDMVIKRNTVLLEKTFRYLTRNFKIKIEVNINDVTQGEVRTFYSMFYPQPFNLQVLEIKWLVGQKIRAFIERTEVRDLFDM